MLVASLLPHGLARCLFGYHCFGIDLYRIARDSIALVSMCPNVSSMNFLVCCLFYACFYNWFPVLALPV